MSNATPTLVVVPLELRQALPPEELLSGAQVHGQDPINQIKAALQRWANNRVELLRIISPGEPGSIPMAGHRITAATLNPLTSDPSAWGLGLRPTGQAWGTTSCTGGMRSLILKSQE